MRSDFSALSRRELLRHSGAGFGSLALAGMLSQTDAFAAPRDPADGPLAVKTPHFAPKAKSVIFLFMYGGPSHIDTFEYKPKMYGMDGKTVDVAVGLIPIASRVRPSCFAASDTILSTSSITT